MNNPDTVPQPQHYPESVALQGLQEQTTEASLADTDRLAMLYASTSPAAYLEVEAESRELQQALALDFDIWASELSDSVLRERAEPALKQLNESRPEDPVELQNASPVFLRHLLRPQWNEHFPADDSPEAQQQWTEFVKQWPEHLQTNLEELQTVDQYLHTLAVNKDLMHEVAEIRTERVEIMRKASTYMVAERRQVTLTKQMAGVYQTAALSNRPLTRAEHRRLEQFGGQQTALRERQRAAVSSEAIIKEIAERRGLQDRRDLEQGLLLTPQMQGIIDEVLPSLMAGKPALLVGETGGGEDGTG